MSNKVSFSGTKYPKRRMTNQNEIIDLVDNTIINAPTIKRENGDWDYRISKKCLNKLLVDVKQALSLREKENKKKISELKAEKEGIIEKVYEMIMKTGSIDNDYVVRKLKEQFKKEVSK